jgi:murein L,D-transpeptidase YcbB/YkuD
MKYMRRLALFLLLSTAGSVFAKDAPLWTHDGRLTAAAVQLLAELGRADERGLLPSDYDAVGLQLRAQQATKAGGAALEHFDSELSRAAARLASDLHQGRVNPASLGYDLDLKREPFDAANAVRTLAGSADIAATLSSLEPRLRHYALLKRALARYRALDATHRDLVWLPSLPRRQVRLGEGYVGAPALRRLLVAVGDDAAEGPAAATQTLDADVVAALKRFQARHGLEPDGVLGRDTFRALTTPFSARVQQIELSLERIRWLPSPLTSPPIIVNIPQFRLFAFRTLEDSAKDILQMDVIVGDTFRARRTPVFAADMQYVVLQPYWDVPRSILLKELLPDIRKRPGWLESHKYEIVRGQGDNASPVPPTAENIELLARGDLRLRQRPGTSNALGHVKFMFPNKHDVYLHDTPARELFSRSRRAFSHGCIRVSDPMALLAYVMRGDPTWSVERRDRALALGTPTRIPLANRIPVFILYGTALATEAGTVLFFDDLYGEDAPLLARIAARSAGLRKSP